jgi:hypothetical protein
MILALTACMSDDDGDYYDSGLATQKSSGSYNRNTLCQNIIRQLGTSGDTVYDAEYSNDPEHQRLLHLYKANGCDK